MKATIVALIGGLAMGFFASTAVAARPVVPAEVVGDCPDGMKSCGERCCNQNEACCVDSDGNYFCDYGRCPS